MMNCAVIMAGGMGERFWPESRVSRPKQFLKLVGDETMLQAAVRRIHRIIPYENIYIVTNGMYRGLVKKQLPGLNEQNILIEPVSRNTAACIGLACVFINKRFADASMVVLASDHIIKNEESFLGIVRKAFKEAEGEKIVTLGIKPNYPETGYGYIKCGEMDDGSICKVERFVEKPDLKTAKQYLADGGYLWNSGMFVWRLGTIMSAFNKYMPGLYRSIIKIGKAVGTKKQNHTIKEEFMKLDSISIDYGVMEKAKNVYVIPCDFGWDDVGSWTSLERLNPKDDSGNVVEGNVVSIDTQGCIVKSDKKLVATIGIEDLIVVDTDDAILICKKDRAQDIKKLVKQIKENSLDSYL